MAQIAAGAGSTAGAGVMAEAAVRQLALRHVPGRAEPRLQSLRAGLVNRSYQVERDARRYVLRVDGEGAAPGVDRLWECRVLRAAAVAGLAPPVIACDPQDGVLVTAWAEGVAWSAQEAAGLAAQTRVAALARRVHALALPDSPRRMDVRGWRDLYRLQMQSRPLDHAQRASLDVANAQSEALLVKYESLPPAPAQLCHSDLHRHNLLVTERDCLLLDWEYAHAGDPFWDLAGWARAGDLPQGSIDALLRAYLLREPQPEEQRRLALLMQIYDVVCRLWAALTAPQSPRAP